MSSLGLDKQVFAPETDSLFTDSPSLSIGAVTPPPGDGYNPQTGPNSWKQWLYPGNTASRCRIRGSVSFQRHELHFADAESLDPEATEAMEPEAASEVSSFNGVHGHAGECASAAGELGAACR
jgi:hypothetical protein